MTSRSNQGRRFQALVTERFIQRFSDWESVRIKDSSGNILRNVDDLRYSKDQGSDLHIEIRDDLPERIQKMVETRIYKIINEEKFW